MEKAIDWINSIISELVDPSIKLKDTLLKVQVLAFKLKNQKLKQWVENEINGYGENEIPAYRVIPTTIYGNMLQDMGFAGARTRNKVPLPVEYLEKELRDELLVIRMSSSVSELEHMLEKGVEYQINIPHKVHNEITNILENNWVIETAWKKIANNNIEGILSAIKSNLLTFMLQLVDEIGENENLDITSKKPKIDKIFDQTIGHLSGETVNITIGSDNIQTVSSGNNASINAATGSDFSQSISKQDLHELSRFTAELKAIIVDIGLKEDDLEETLVEIRRLETQLQRETPKFPIINSSLKTIYGILLGVAGNVITPTVMENLQKLIKLFSQ